MFGFGLSKRVKELEKEIKSLNKKLVFRVGEDLRENKKHWITEPISGIAYPIDVIPKDNRPTVDVLDAFVLITTHLGLKFEVEPAKGEQVKLVKVKK